jgi:predicted enzyme related to lactoylglutathione lyase
LPTSENSPQGTPVWVHLETPDRDASARFYSGLFGWDIGDPEPALDHYINFSIEGDLVAGLIQVPTDESEWRLFLSSSDVEAISNEAAKLGAQVIVSNDVVGNLGSMAIYVDPAGAMIGAWQAKDLVGFVQRNVGGPVWHELHTNDYDNEVLFYRSLFSWVPAEVMDNAGFRYTSIRGVNVGIFDATEQLSANEGPHWVTYFGVSDSDVAVQAAIQLGATVLSGARDTPYGRMAVLRDPFGAKFVAMSDS